MNEPKQDAPLIDWALYWAAQGIPVFPCLKSKAPLTKNGFKDAEIEPDKIRALFDFYGDTAEMIGGATGEKSGLLVVDVDLYKAGAKEWLEDNGAVLGNTRVHKTMSGGLHLLYEADEYPQISVNAGVETRGDGGYIILPGSPGYSVHQGGLTRIGKDAMEVIQAAKRQKKLSPSSALETEILSALTFHEPMVQLAARKAREGLTIAGIQAYLLDLMGASIASKPQHPRHSRWHSIMSGDEITKIAQSGYGKYNREGVVQDYLKDIDDEVLGQLEADTEHVFPAQNNEVEIPEYVPQKGVWPYEGEGYFANVEHDLADQAFTMYPIFAENESVVMFAEPKAGKTALSLTCAIHIALGEDFGKFQVAEAGPCLYFGLEGTRAIRLRIAAFKKDWLEQGKQLPDHIPLFIVESATAFYKDEAKKAHAAKIGEANEQSITKYGSPLKLIVIDTLTKAMGGGGDQNSAEDTETLFEIIDMVRQRGVTATILFVHHKARAGGNARGSSNIEASPDVLLDVSKDGDLIDMNIARARSIEDGQHYKFKLEGVDLGVNRQGHPLAGVLPRPVEMGEIQNDFLDALIGLGVQQELHSIPTIKQLMLERGMFKDGAPKGNGPVEEALLAALGGESFVGERVALAIRRTGQRIAGLEIKALGG